MRHIFVCLPIAILCAAVILADENTTNPETKKPGTDEKTIRSLIVQLGDDDFRVREAAQKRLTDIGYPVLPLLHKAAKVGEDLEVLERVQLISQAIGSTLIREIRRFERARAEQGNNNWSTRLAMTPDGRRVVGVRFGSLRCWNIDDGKESVIFDWPDSQTSSWGLCLSRDGQKLIVGSEDKVARVFDMKTGKLVVELKGHSAAVQGADFLPDGKRAVTGGFDRSLRLWDLESGREIRAFEDVTEDVQCLAVSPDGKLVAVGHTTGYEVPGTIRLWDVETGRIASTLAGHAKRLCSVHFAPDGKTLVSSSFDKTVRLWDVSQGKLLKALEGHPNRVEGAVFTLDGKRVLSVGNQDNPIVMLWDAASGELLYQSAPAAAGLLDVAALPDGRHCLICGKDGSVRLWELRR